MKKIVAISLAFIYLLVSSGVMVEIHHCMGRIADTGIAFFVQEEEDTCGTCGMVTADLSGHCCKAEYKLVKINDDQKPASEISEIVPPAVSILSQGWPENMAGISDAAPVKTVFFQPPPPPLNASRRSLLCVFRI